MIAIDHSHADSSLDPDAERMTRVSAGDREAFDELVDRHFGSTVRIISSMLGSQSQSEDLAQEVFLRIYRHRARYLPTAKFATWLGTIIRNVVLNAKRSQARNRVFVTDFVEDWRGAGGRLVPQVNADASLHFDEQEIVAAVSEAMGQLPTRQRVAIELVYLRGMSYLLASKEMETSWKAVKSLLGRGRAALEEALRDEYQSRFETAN